MMDWLEEAKKLAKEEAENIIADISRTAISKDLDARWYVEEVIKNLNQMKPE